MKLTDKRFWIAWNVLFILMVGCCLSESWSEDTALLGGAYALSLLSTWLCHRARPGVAYGNLTVMVVYNAIFAYNLVFNSRYGAGMTWWSLCGAFKYRSCHYNFNLQHYYTMSAKEAPKTLILQIREF